MFIQCGIPSCLYKAGPMLTDLNPRGTKLSTPVKANVLHCTATANLRVQVTLHSRSFFRALTGLCITPHLNMSWLKYIQCEHGLNCPSDKTFIFCEKRPMSQLHPD